MPEATEDASLHFLDYWRVIKSRKEVILAVTLLVVITGVAFTFTMPNIYTAETRIEVRQDALNIPVFERGGGLMPGYNPYFLRTQYEIIQSKSILHPVIKNLDLARAWGKEFNEDGSPLTLDQAYTVLQGSVRVEQSRDTSLIAIRVSREDPREAARLANEIATVYRNYRLSLKRNEIKLAIDALNSELEKQQDKVNQAEAEVEQLRQHLGVSILREGLRADSIRLQQMEADRIAARVELMERKARLEQLQTLDGEELMNAAAYIVNDMVLATIRRQLIDSEVTLKLLLENFGKNHPEVRRVQAAVDELREKLNDALIGLKRGLAANFAVAEAKFKALESELNAARESDIVAEAEKYLPFQKAQRNLLIQRAILEAVQARVAQEGIELEVPRTPVEIVDEAEPPPRPSSPNFMLNILLSLFLGLGAGVGLAYFIEYLDTSVKTVEDIERFLGLPVIGIIPQKVRPLIEEGPGSPHAESYRVLRTNIQLGIKGRTGGAIAVCSGGVGEGKSTTLANLAYVCAQLGDRVLVVDSDLRRPVQHRIFGMSNRVGLTDVLMRDAKLEDMILPTSAPNLHFLPSGKLSRTMVGLLDSQRMRDLVKNLKARYDYIFFDTPPLMGVSDASILASEVDGVLLVVQYRKYPRIISSRAKRILDSVGVSIYGVVLNNINILRDDYYYYYHSYYSHYYQPEEAKLEAPAARAAASKKEQVL
jgi:succinoglycan biosynthesis transport protein ExoP